MNVIMRREQRNTYMASIVSSDPMRPRCDAKLFLAAPRKALKAVRVRFEHGIVSYADGYHHFTTCLNVHNSSYHYSDQYKIFMQYSLIDTRVCAC